MNRIAITHVTFIGVTVETATVEFGEGMTLIHGPSDTGKSFVTNAIDFMLGAKSLKEIPERQGYSTVLLGLRLSDGSLATLSRSVDGGNIGLYLDDIRSAPSGLPDKTLAPRHHATSDENISRYLLSSTDLEDRKVRKNARNETDSLSFRNVAHLCVVDETQMQSLVPPALTGNYVSKTKEISVLKLMLQNEDDSALIPVPSGVESQRLIGARLEVIDRLLADLREQLSGIAGLNDLEAQIRKLDDTIAKQGESIGKLTEERDRLAKRYTELHTNENDTQRMLEDAQALRARLGLLLKQYDSDLARLEMISEAGSLLGYFTPGICVFCGADPEHQHLNLSCDEDSTSFAESVQTERQKTSSLRVDLIATLEQLENEQVSLDERLEALRAQTRQVSALIQKIDQSLRPHRVNLNELFGARSRIEKGIGIYAQVEHLEQVRRQLETEVTAGTAAAVSGIDLAVIREFSSTIAARLQAWGFPDSSSVRYDRSEQDIVAGDQLRSAHGKGVRAILHAAFTIALAQYCLDRDIPHPGFIVLDSPLVTYRPPDQEASDHALEAEAPDTEEQAINEGLVTAFYADMQQAFDGQVIIIENTDPPQLLKSTSIDVAFTKQVNSGRYGFFAAEDSARGLIRPDND